MSFNSTYLASMLMINMSFLLNSLSHFSIEVYLRLEESDFRFVDFQIEVFDLVLVDGFSLVVLVLQLLFDVL